MPDQTLTVAKAMLDRQGALYSQILDALGPTAPERKRLGEALTTAHEEMFIATVLSLGPGLVVEVGAYDAAFSRRIKRALPGTQVIAFEAFSEVFALFRDQVVAAGVDYRPDCVASTAGTVQFTVPMKGAKPRDSMGSMRRLAAEDEVIVTQVNAVTLASVVGPAEDYALWIDVEGAVGDILKGAGETLSRCRAVFVELETRPHWDGQMLDGEIIALLHDAGLVPVGRDVQRSWQYNAIFLRPDDIAAHYSTAALEVFIRGNVGPPGAA